MSLSTANTGPSGVGPNFFLDSETASLHSVPVIFQWAKDDGPIEIHEIWRRPMGETLDLLEEVCQGTLIGFNLSFDVLMMIKIYTMFHLWGDRDAIPEDLIPELADIEMDARFGPTLKPRSACDLMLHARKGPYQSLMERDDVKIKKVPAILADRLAEELCERVKVDGIYFARRKDKYAPQWKVESTPDPDLMNVVLRFSPKGDLKTLAAHALGEEVKYRYTDVEIDPAFWADDVGWAPWAKAVKGTVKSKARSVSQIRRAWPQVLHHHINHWAYRDDAREYATKDVDYTRKLYDYFGRPEPGDDDSMLACYVAATRWRGFAVDVERMKKQLKACREEYKDVPMSASAAWRYITEPMQPTEVQAFGKSTNKTALNNAAKMECDCVFLEEKECPLCKGTRLHPSAVRAKEVLKARKAKKESEIYEKIIEAGRLHPSYKVIGSLSGRMSSGDGLNTMGIKATKPVRQCFTFADRGMQFDGGDMSSFEVVIADAVYNDPKLRDALTREEECPICEGKGCGDCNGGRSPKKIHALFAMKLYPGTSYVDIMKSKGSKTLDMYKNGKTAVFAILYGGGPDTISRKQNIDIEIAQKAYDDFMREYPGVAAAKLKVERSFKSMVQPGGLGTRVEWHEPVEYMESLFGFRRYFSLENSICKALFDLGEKPPKEWLAIKTKIVRNQERGPQFVGGAVRSALFGAAFGIQNSALRQAGNHEIQSSGATIVKRIQRKLWDLQPAGVHEFLCPAMQIHDEILVCCKPELSDTVERVVQSTVDTFRGRIPLINIDWKKNLKDWSQK